MSRKGHFDGKKQCGTHTTIIDAAIKFVAAADRIPEVKKISLGFIKSRGIHNNKPQIRFTKLRAGLEVNVIGATSRQVFHIFTESPDLVIQLLEDKT